MARVRIAALNEALFDDPPALATILRKLLQEVEDDPTDVEDLVVRLTGAGSGIASFSWYEDIAKQSEPWAN